MKHHLCNNLIKEVMLMLSILLLFVCTSALAEVQTVNLTQQQDVSISVSNGAGYRGLIDGNNTNAGGTYEDNDGNICYYAWSFNSKNTEYAVIDLGYVYSISQIKLYLGYPGSTYSNGPEVFEVYCSQNNDNYTLVAYESSIKAGTYKNGIYTKDLTAAVKARYIKLVIPGADTARVIRVRELEIYGNNDLPVKIVYPNSPSYLQNKADAQLNVIISNDKSIDSSVYKIEYSPNGDFTDTVSQMVTVNAGENANIKVDLSLLKKGKYPDFSTRVYIDDEIVEELSCPVTIIEFAQKVPFSEYSRIGLNWHTDSHTTSYTRGIDVENYNKLMNNMGVVNTRSLHRWAWLETKKGERPFEKHEYFQNLMVKYGQNFSPYILGFGNALYYPEEPVTYRDVMDTVEYNTQMLEHLEKKGIEVKSVEIWNEPNLINFWGSERWITYSQLANRMAFEIKKLYPEKQIMGGAVSATGTNNTKGEDFIKSHLKRGALMYVDAISCHPYTFTYNPDQKHLSRTGDFANLRDVAGGWIDVSVTEVGYPTHVNSWGVTDIEQAQYLPKYFVYNDELDVSLTDLYTFEDTGNDITDREQNFGIIQKNFVPKEGYVSMAQLVKQLNSAQYVGRFAVDDKAYAYVYAGAERIFAVTWAHDKNYSFTYNLENGARAQDLYGNPMQPENGVVTIGTDPVYLINLPEKYLFNAVETQAKVGLDEILSAYGDNKTVADKIVNFRDMFASNINNENDLKLLIDDLYACGTYFAEGFETSGLALKDLSVILSKLHRIAKRTAAAYSYYDIAQKSCESEYERVNDLIAQKKGAESDSSLLYTDAIMRFAQRYKNKAQEIGENYNDDIAGKKGLKGISDIMAENLALWAEKIMKFEEPDLSRAVFTYLSNTNPVINKGQTVTLSVTVENALSEHDLNGQITITDDIGNTLGSILPCVVKKGTTEEIPFDITLPYLDKDKTTLYVNILQDGKLFKQSEIEVDVSEAFSASSINVLNLELYTAEGKVASPDNIVEGNELKAVCAVSKNEDVSECVYLIISQYKNDELYSAEMLPIKDAVTESTQSVEAQISKNISVGEGVNKIALFVWDINALECMAYSRKVEKQ